MHTRPILAPITKSHQTFVISLGILMETTWFLMTERKVSRLVTLKTQLSALALMSEVSTRKPANVKMSESSEANAWSHFHLPPVECGQ